MTETRQTTVAMDESWNDLIYALTGGGPGFETEVLGSTVYKLFATGSYGIATAGYLIIFILACVVVLPINHWVSKKSEDL